MRIETTLSVRAACIAAVLISPITTFAGNSVPEPATFNRAKPVWPVSRQRDMNLLVGFKATIDVPADGGPVQLRLAASSLYRAFVNGAFVGHGPARAAHGYYRIDEWDITSRVEPGRNVVAIEAAATNIDSYYVLNQPPFLQAEIVADGRVLAATGADGDARFDAFMLPQRIRKVQRYSQQRTFIEAYRLSPDADASRTDGDSNLDAVDCATLTPKRLLPRGVPYPDFTRRWPVRNVAAGEISKRRDVDAEKAESIALLGLKRGGYQLEEMEVTPAIDLQYMDFNPHAVDKPWPPEQPLPLGENTFRIVDFGVNLTGFVGVQLICEKPTKLYVTFDEILDSGDVNFRRNNAAGVIYLELTPGTHRFESFEPYTMRYLKFAVTDGACSVGGIYLREFANRDVWEASFACSDPRLNRLFEAARNTLRQNATDIFMDCPSRERAGWLCDSFFAARAAFDLCGDAAVERNFLGNYLLLEDYDRLPSGMLPMVYPADSRPNSFIPNWAMWFVLELEEYLDRTGDRETVDDFKPKVLGLIGYFKEFRNRDGLLEDLDGWVFIEWSAANSFTKGVNYPTNMLYAGMLDAAGRVYDISELRADARDMRETILQQSFDGQWFVDNARREGTRLRATGNRTETCQYYALYFNVATPESHPALWTRLRDEFGPKRRETAAYPEIHPSNTFIGNVLRLELLSRYGRPADVVDELLDGYLYMADRTGTLWENVDPRASCNHGFASHVAHVLYRDVLGIRELNHREGRVTVRVPRLPLAWCEGVLPTPAGPLQMRWNRDGKTSDHQLAAPSHYRVTVEP